jgi:hypothetical protein
MLSAEFYYQDWIKVDASLGLPVVLQELTSSRIEQTTPSCAAVRAAATSHTAPLWKEQ